MNFSLGPKDLDLDNLGSKIAIDLFRRTGHSAKRKLAYKLFGRSRRLADLGQEGKKEVAPRGVEVERCEYEKQCNHGS